MLKLREEWLEFSFKFGYWKSNQTAFSTKFCLWWNCFLFGCIWLVWTIGKHSQGITAYSLAGLFWFRNVKCSFGFLNGKVRVIYIVWFCTKAVCALVCEWLGRCILSVVKSKWEWERQCVCIYTHMHTSLTVTESSSSSRNHGY